MSKFVIAGGKKLNGTWHVQGGKNAATPVLAATLLTREPCTIRNIPRISDIAHMLAIMEKLGTKTRWKDEHTVHIHTPKIKTYELDYLLSKRMRSSVLFMGPVLSILGKVRIPEPGGCSLGNRSLEAHTKGFESLGAEVEIGNDEYYTITGDNLQAGSLDLTERSVTATENIIMAASRLPGTTTIKNAALEPHIVCLCDFLIAMGVTITGHGTTEISIQGNEELNGVEFEVIPDQLEIGTVAVLAALCSDSITISPVVPRDMKSVKEKLLEAGVDLTEEGSTWTVKQSKDKLKAFKITTAPHPGFPTDLQAPFGVLATQAQGKSIIHDPMYENRLQYIRELNKLGSRAEILDAHTAEVKGVTELQGEELNSLDLRAGATLLIAGLAAQGTTTIHQAENIDRGYERIDERLRLLGAHIKRVE
jgi:UDP-N-acetylglucosamine 1-carboxyvinyltransferase